MFIPASAKPITCWRNTGADPQFKRTEQCSAGATTDIKNVATPCGETLRVVRSGSSPQRVENSPNPGTSQTALADTGPDCSRKEFVRSVDGRSQIRKVGPYGILVAADVVLACADQVVSAARLPLRLLRGEQVVARGVGVPTYGPADMPNNVAEQEYGFRYCLANTKLEAICR